MKENRDRCKYIANEIEKIASCDYHKCPHCGEVHEMGEYEESEHENEAGYTCYTCPCCKEEIEEDDLEELSMWDYFNDVFDIEYRIGSDKEYRSVCVMVACGGPNIYVDTQSKRVELYWGGEEAHAYLSNEACAEIDSIFEELFNC